MIVTRSAHVGRPLFLSTPVPSFLFETRLPQICVPDLGSTTSSQPQSRSGILQTSRAIGKRLTELFSVSPLIVSGVVAFLLRSVEWGLIFDLPLVILLLLYVFWITPNYFFEIIESKATGNTGWPVFSLETLVAGRNQVGVVFAGLVLAAGAGYAGLKYIEMSGAAQILLGAGLFLLPGSMALLAVTREFSAALNPLRVLSAAQAMGIGYLFCLFGAVLIMVLLELAYERGGLPIYFLLAFGVFLQAYLIGGIVYARRRELGVYAPSSPEAKAEREQATNTAIRSGVLSHAYGFAAHGNRAGSLSHIEAYIEKEDDSLEARLWMFNEMSRWEDKAIAVRFGQRVIEYCEQHGFTDEAARVTMMCGHLDSQ